MKTSAITRSSGCSRGRPQLWPDPQILLRARHISAKRPGSVPAPMRVIEEGARHRHHVGLTFGDDRFGLLRLENEADRAGWNAGFAPHFLGDGDVVALIARIARIGGDTA